MRHQVNIVRLRPPRDFDCLSETTNIADVNPRIVGQTFLDKWQELPFGSKLLQVEKPHRVHAGTITTVSAERQPLNEQTGTGFATTHVHLPRRVQKVAE
jgi:hypothetical protein